MRKTCILILNLPQTWYATQAWTFNLSFMSFPIGFIFTLVKISRDSPSQGERQGVLSSTDLKGSSRYPLPKFLTIFSQLTGLQAHWPCKHRTNLASGCLHLQLLSMESLSPRHLQCLAIHLLQVFTQKLFQWKWHWNRTTLFLFSLPLLWPISPCDTEIICLMFLSSTWMLGPHCCTHRT